MTPRQKEERRIVKYLAGTAKAMEALSKEIKKEGFTKEHQDLMKEMGSRTLCIAVFFDYIN